MAQFVLVHGSFHGSWCWSRLAPRLAALGHAVTAPDLPGSGDDPAPREKANLATYAARVAQAIDACPGPVILVGHSMGGIVSAQVSEWRAERLAATVYVNGLLFRPGETLVGFLEAHAHLGVEDLVLKNMQVAPDGATATFPASAAGDIFYNCCTPEDAAWAAGRLTPQRMAVYADPLMLSEARFGRVRRFYVEGTRDAAVPLVYQRAMTERTPCEAIVTLECDHSPFLSVPDALAQTLDDIAARVA